MKSLKKDFNERLTTAADAKKALLEKFKARPSFDDPAVAERRAEREALSKAREERFPSAQPPAPRQKRLGSKPKNRPLDAESRTRPKPPNAFSAKLLRDRTQGR